MTEQGEFLPLGLRSFHAVMWKMIIIEFSRVGMNEGTVFNTKTILPFTISRLQTRMNALYFTHRRRWRNARRRGKPPPSTTKINSLLSPLASVAEDKIVWHSGWLGLCAFYKVEIT